MGYHLDYRFDGLTEEEQDQLLSRLEIIKDKIYPELDIDFSCLHRENRVWIDQEITDDNKALELFKLLSGVGVDKAYDDYYETGEDSHLSVNLNYTKEYPLD